MTPAKVCGVDRIRSKSARANQTPRAMAPTTAVAKTAVPTNVVGRLLNLPISIENMETAAGFHIQNVRVNR